MLLALALVLFGAGIGIGAGILLLGAAMVIYKQKQTFPFKKIVLGILGLFGIGAWIGGIWFTILTIRILPEIFSLF